MQQNSQFVFLGALWAGGGFKISFKRYTGWELDEHYPKGSYLT
jgi:hypothetical protein